MTGSRLVIRCLLASALGTGVFGACAATIGGGLAIAVNPLIGSANGGNTFPGAVLPFGMLQFSPETSRGKHNRTAAPGGYQYKATRIRGFALTHLSGTGCAGASGDIPLMPITEAVTTSPSSDATDARYASNFLHADESASAGLYKVRMANGVSVALTAALRSGMAQIDFPEGKPANLLVRTSDSEVGSSDAHVKVDARQGTVTGSVTSGNFCGYLAKADRKSYYTLYFVAQFDQPFTVGGAWVDDKVTKGAATASGGTTYGKKGFFPIGRGSGAWIGFGNQGAKVTMRVGISYVSLTNARANLQAEIPRGASFASVRDAAAAAWNKALGGIAIDGGTSDQRTTFYTALYHVMMHPNLYSDVNGQYRGFDQKTHQVQAPQEAQYANFSGWDIYRSHLQLVTWLDPRRGSDIAQSLYNQARQNHGEWDRWTHNSGGTHVMSGDPSVPALADIAAFGGNQFDLKGAYQSLVKAATTVTANDLSDAGCNVECVGQRPSLDQWLKLHYIAAKSHAWAGAAETLEDATADFALAELAQRVGDEKGRQQWMTRAGYWRNIFNSRAAPDGGYIQNRNADGSWPKFDPASDDGFVEAGAAVYLWMVPFDIHGLFGALGGKAAATKRLDAFFHTSDGKWALTNAGPLHAELNNEPSVATPWLYDYTGQPWKTQDAVRIVVDTIWKNSPDGIPGNDDLGEMSSWYVWAALGMYPEIPGRAELLLGSPLFPRAVIHGSGGDVTIIAANASAATPYVQSLQVDGKPHTRPWLTPALVEHGGALNYVMGDKVNKHWGSDSDGEPPSFPPPAH
ncbi:MAG: GH92 family glycosyl hydrolase [Rhodanobacter sp.]